MKFEFNTIYNGYSNESPFKYYISILEGGNAPGACDKDESGPNFFTIAPD